MLIETIQRDRSARRDEKFAPAPLDRSVPPPVAANRPADRHAYRAPGSRRIVGSVATAAVFAAVLAGSMLTLGWIAPPKPAPKPLTVLMLPADAPAPKPEAAPPKRPPTPAAKLQPHSVQPPLPAAPTPIVQVGTAAAPTLDFAPPAPPQPVAPPQVAAPAPPAPAAERSHGPQTWESRVLARIARFRSYPPEAKRGKVQGVASIRFRMDRAGHVLSSSLERSSGNPLLDQAALDALRRADPLPRIPADRPDEVDLSVAMDFSLTR